MKENGLEIATAPTPKRLEGSLTVSEEDPTTFTDSNLQYNIGIKISLPEEIKQQVVYQRNTSSLPEEDRGVYQRKTGSLPKEYD